jgi:predicted outer membrane repeat protein
MWLDWGTNPKVHTASPYTDTITGLTAGETYDVQLTYSDADGVNGINPQTVTVSLTTAEITVCNPGGQFTTIQSAIADPGTTNGSTLLVCAGTYSENINFLGKAITVKSVSGASLTTIQGINNPYPGKPVVTFSTGETASAVLDGFTIDNIDSDQATRGIYISAATPTIKNCIIQGNSATNCSEDSSVCGGGGIYIKNSAPTFVSCTIRNNAATNRNGGGIYITGAAGGATITNSTIGGSGFANSANNGGGIYFTGSATGALSVNDSAIAYNTVTQYGGGIYITGITNTTTFANTSINNNTASQSAGGVYSNNSALSLTDSNISSNATGSTASYDGGGVFLNGTSASATISGGTINGNSGRYGGGVFITGSTAATPLSISNVTMSSNTGYLGGALYLTGVTNTVSITGTTISGNTGQAGGGGIYNNAVTLDISNSHIDSNTVTGGGQKGGGLFLIGAKTTTVTDTTVDSNTTTGLGGGIYVGGGASLSLTGGSINSNATSGGSGAGVALDGASVLNIAKADIRGNRGGNQYGGGFYFASSAATLSSVINCNITGNTAGIQSYTAGGGFYINGGSMDIINSTIAGNYSPNIGGGIRVQAGAVNVKNGIIQGNTAVTSGPQISGTPTVAYSDIAGGFAGTGNIDSDPLFVSFTAGDKAAYDEPKTSGDFHIQGGSPCKDTGNNADAPAGTDIDGDTRILNGTVDMGSDEYVP